MRGGKREGAGRKSVLNWGQLVDIGAMCDRLQSQRAYAASLAEHEKRPGMKRVKDAWSRLAEIRPAGGKQLTPAQRKQAARIIKTDVHPVLNERGARFVPIRKFDTRAQIIQLVSDHCTKRLGLKGITPRRVEAGWKAYRALVKASRLNSARVSEGAED